MTDEADVIEHLLEVEREASRVIDEAREKSDAIIAVARAKVETQFKERYSEFISKLDAKESEDKDKIDSEHKKELEDYIKSVDSNKKTKEEFCTLLEKLLYA